MYARFGTEMHFQISRFHFAVCHVVNSHRLISAPPPHLTPPHPAATYVLATAVDTCSPIVHGSTLPSRNCHRTLRCGIFLQIAAPKPAINVTSDLTTAMELNHLFSTWAYCNFYLPRKFQELNFYICRRRTVVATDFLVFLQDFHTTSVLQFTLRQQP
jgi:hypothetical protein